MSVWQATSPKDTAEKDEVNTFNFLHIALGSLRELDTQLIISKNVNLAKPEYIDSVLIDCDEMQKLVKSTINTLQSKAK